MTWGFRNSNILCLRHIAVDFLIDSDFALARICYSKYNTIQYSAPARHILYTYTHFVYREAFTGLELN